MRGNSKLTQQHKEVAAQNYNQLQDNKMNWTKRKHVMKCVMLNKTPEINLPRNIFFSRT